MIEAIVALGVAVGTVGLMTLVNRREIARVKDGIFGHDRSRRNGGLEGDVDSIRETLECIQETQIEFRNELRSEIHHNREAVAELADHTGTEIEIEAD